MRTITTAISIAVVALSAPVAQATTQTERAASYIERLAHNAPGAEIEDNCLLLRSHYLCGYRIRLLARARSLRGVLDVEDCDYTFKYCPYDLEGRTSKTRFSCTGTVAWGRTWVRSDVAVDCYAADDPTWFEYSDGVIIRTPH